MNAHGWRGNTTDGGRNHRVSLALCFIRGIAQPSVGIDLAGQTHRRRGRRDKKRQVVHRLRRFAQIILGVSK